VGLTAALELALKVLLLPPACLLLLYGVGWLMARRLPRLGSVLRHGAVLLLYLLSTGAGSWLVAHPLESLEPPLVLAGPPQAQAIVVLTAGRVRRSPEYGQRTIPDFIALTRMTYAAGLVRSTGLPLLVTGGLPGRAGEDEALASSMKRVFEQQFGIPVRWSETGSRNTAENASLSATILRAHGIDRIILVTDALHMRRARLAFERQGIAVTSGPTFYVESGEWDPLRVLPTAENLWRSYSALYEWLALAWYQLVALR
jgi:uncharacterized SAM-binding protein YcdF (DUF218 family)